MKSRLIREELAAAVARAAQETAGDALPAIHLDVPPAPELGDFTTDAAVELARLRKESAGETAARLAERLELPEGLVRHVEATPSGFLNFHLAPGWIEAQLRAAAAEGEAYGRAPDLGAGRSVLVEFVSADPTGPLTVTHGRGAALGDSLANLLEWNGFRVAREFYVNDAGAPMERFGRALEARYLRALGVPGAPASEDGHAGSFLAAVAAEILAEAGDRYRDLPAEQRLAALIRHGRELVVSRQRETLARFGVWFDDWYSEEELHASSKLERALQRLRQSGFTYELEGALWLRTSALGAAEDFPLVRSNGRPAYFAGDLAYHLDKLERGFDRLVNVWGPAHANYIERTRAGLRALGGDPALLDVVLFQPVALKVHETIIEEGALAGNFFPLEEVIEQVGAAVARFLYLTRPASQPLDLDLDLVSAGESADPASRVRRAAARLSEIAAGDGSGMAGVPAAFERLSEEWDVALMRRLAHFPDEVRAAARELEPHRINQYLQETAVLVEGWSPDTGDARQRETRRAVAAVADTVMRNGLRLLGVAFS